MSTVSSEVEKGGGPLPFQDIGREEKRRYILNAAAVVFGAKGFHEVTVKDIVQQAGIAHGTFYLYFKDKKDAYRALASELQSQIMAVILPGGVTEAPPGGADPSPLVRKRLSDLARLFERESSFARVFVYRAPGSDPELEEQRRRFVGDLTDGIAAVLRDGAERGFFRRHDPRVAAMCLVGSIEMVIESWLRTANDPTGPALAEMMDQAARFFLPSLLPPMSERGAAVGAPGETSTPEGRRTR
jgi:TetR/AcrR family fatty acid metabolism transcriptional regulator